MSVVPTSQDKVERTLRHPDFEWRSNGLTVQNMNDIWFIGRKWQRKLSRFWQHGSSPPLKSKRIMVLSIRSSPICFENVVICSDETWQWACAFEMRPTNKRNDQVICLIKLSYIVYRCPPKKVYRLSACFHSTNCLLKRHRETEMKRKKPETDIQRRTNATNLLRNYIISP